MKTTTRREFMGSLAAAGALAGRALARPQDRKLRLGLIGSGWYGMVDLKAAFKAGGVEAAALCDVDSAHLAQCAEEVGKLQGARPRTFKDYRELIAMPGLDAVIIATPPHFKGKITTPDVLTASFDFEKCPVLWRHRLWGAAEYSPEVSNGIFYYCEKETVFATDGRWVVIPEGKGERREMPARLKGDEHQARHVAEFISALRERRQPSCLPPDAADSAATVQLAMISYYSGTAVKWDRARRQIPDNPAASQLLKREYRKPWTHPYSG